MRRLVIVATAAVLLVACGSGAAEPEPEPTATTSQFQTATPPATPTARATATAFPPTPTPKGPPPVGPRLIPDARVVPAEPIRVALPLLPDSPFEPWDAVSTMLYDFKSGEALNFGPGTSIAFSSNGSYGVWTSGDAFLIPHDPESVVKVIDIASGEVIEVAGHPWSRSSLGPDWFDLYNWDTGERERYSAPGGEPMGASPFEVPASAPNRSYANPMGTGAHTLVIVAKRTYEIHFVETGHVVQFAVAQVRLTVNSDELLIVVDLGAGRGGLFIYDPALDDTEFLAAFEYYPGDLLGISASRRFVAWNRDFCRDDRGETFVLSRDDGSVRVVTPGFWPKFVGESILGAGFTSTGAAAVLDLEKMEFVAAAPEMEGVPVAGRSFNWTQDGMMGSWGGGGAAGGVCMGEAPTPVP